MSFEEKNNNLYQQFLSVCLESRNLANFQTINILIRNDKTIPINKLNELKNHLEILITNFDSYLSPNEDHSKELFSI